MLLFFLILVAIFSVSTTIVLWMELSVTSNTVDWLEDRLTKLEKDAVKVTFSEPPLFHRKPKIQTDYQNEHVFHPEVKKKSNPKQFDGVKSEEPFIITRKKRKPKTVGEWEDEIDLGGHE